MVLSFLPFKGMEPRGPEALWGTSQFDSWFLLDIVDHITTKYMTVASLGPKARGGQTNKTHLYKNTGFLHYAHIYAWVFHV